MGDEVIMANIKPVLGYAVLKKTQLPGIGPKIDCVVLWHGQNNLDPEHSAKVTLNQLRKLNRNERTTFAIALVSMPPEDSWS